MSSKILTIGPPAGRIKELISKVGAIQAKHGPFDALFILGDLFTPLPLDPKDALDAKLNQEEIHLLSGNLQLPIQTYFYQGSSLLHPSILEKLDGQQTPVKKVADNLSYVGKSGVFETEQGFRVAFCGGRWDPAQWVASLSSSSLSEHPRSDDTREIKENAPQVEEAADLESPYITSHTIQRLLSHPSLTLPKPVVSAAGVGGAQTLAAARVQAAAQTALESQHADNLSILEARKPIDLLLTSYWSSGVTLFSTTDLPDPTSRTWGCPPITSLAKAATPRYHFALAPDHTYPTTIAGLSDHSRETGTFWEREPYLNDFTSFLSPSSSTEVHRHNLKKWQPVTRFISLARFANPSKKRWFMALNLVPQQTDGQRPTSFTSSPYLTGSSSSVNLATTSNKRRETEDGSEAEPNYRWSATTAPTKKARTEKTVPPDGYACKICESTQHYIKQCPEKGKNQGQNQHPNQNENPNLNLGEKDAERERHQLPTKPKSAATLTKKQVLPVGPQDCWFCLSNPQCAKHLVVTIGNEWYIALPRGPFSNDSVAGGGHVLILPLTHVPAISAVEDVDPNDLISELQQYKSIISQVYQRYETVMVSWTLVRRGGSRIGHLQFQSVAINPQDVQTVSDRFDQLLNAKTNGTLLITDVQQIQTFFSTETKKDYFVLQVAEKQWLLQLEPTDRFPIQFARQTLAQVLHVPQLADWKSCTKSEEQEKHDTLQFRKAFQEIESASD